MRENQSYKVSVIIPTFNRKDILKECLQALFTQNLDLSWYEIIVVDDGSTDNTDVIAKSYEQYPNFNYIRQENSGPAVARNKGAKVARGELLVFIDDDVIASPNLINAHIGTHQSNPAAAVLGFTPFKPEYVKNLNTAYHKRRWDNIYRRIAAIHGHIPYYYFMTLNISLGREVFLRLGGFDESFRNSANFLQEKGLGAAVAFEDTEFGYRFVESGHKLIFCREAYADHLFHTTFAGSCKRNYKNGYLAGMLYEKFPHLKERFKVDYALNYITKRDNIRTRMKKYLKRRLGNEPILKIFQKTISIIEKIMPKKILYYLYAIIESNYYALGFREGYKYKNCSKEQA